MALFLVAREESEYRNRIAAPVFNGDFASSSDEIALFRLLFAHAAAVFRR